MRAIAGIFVRQVGWLRVGLYTLALLSVVFRPQPGGEVVYEGWAIATTLLIPTLSPLIFMGLLLDVLMTLVLRADKTGAERRRYRTVLVSDLIMVVIMAIAWVPFFRALGQ